jgi:hypothetical protein
VAIAGDVVIVPRGDDASALALVVSLNAQRRDLTAAQRAIVAARALPLFEAAGLARKSEGGKNKGKTGGNSATPHRSRDDAAKVFKVGPDSVQQAKALLAEAPDLAVQVEGCTLSLALRGGVSLHDRLRVAQHDRFHRPHLGRLQIGDGDGALAGRGH